MFGDCKNHIVLLYFFLVLAVYFIVSVVYYFFGSIQYHKTMKQIIHTNSAEETQEFAQVLGRKLHGGDILLLFGDLGAGKTTFMQGLAKGLGIDHRVTSPTFIIMRKFDISEGYIQALYHLDLYRTETDADLEGIGLREILQNHRFITAIEWPEKLRSFLPEKRIELHFKTLSEHEREIEMDVIQ